MKLTIVGCSGSVPGADSPASSYLVEHEGVRLLLDLGNGAIGPLQRYADPAEVDAILLSHLHADHCLDMCPYVVYHRHRPGKRLPPVPVLGPKDTSATMSRIYGGNADLTDVFDYSSLAEGPWDIGPFTITSERVKHPVETYAIRVEAEDRVLTYSGDTGRSDALVRLAEGSDVLLCEATFESGQDAPPDLHLTGGEAGAHARKAGVDRLLLTHIPPWSDQVRTLGEASEAFDGLTEIVAAGASYRI